DALPICRSPSSSCRAAPRDAGQPLDALLRPALELTAERPAPFLETAVLEADVGIDPEIEARPPQLVAQHNVLAEQDRLTAPLRELEVEDVFGRELAPLVEMHVRRRRLGERFHRATRHEQESGWHHPRLEETAFGAAGRLEREPGRIRLDRIDARDDVLRVRQQLQDAPRIEAQVAIEPENVRVSRLVEEPLREVVARVLDEREAGGHLELELDAMLSAEEQIGRAS